MCICLCVCACEKKARGGQKRVPDPLDLVTDVCMPPLWVLEIESGSSVRAACALNQ